MWGVYIIINKTKEKRYRWDSIPCRIAEILYIIKKNIQFNEVEMVIAYQGQRYSIGITCDFDSLANQYYDRMFHVDDQEFETFNEFLEKAKIGNIHLRFIKYKIEVLEINWDNPKHYKLLTDVAAKKNNNELWEIINSDETQNIKEDRAKKQIGILTKRRSKTVGDVSFWEYFKYILPYRPHSRKPKDAYGNVYFEENASQNFFIRELLIRTSNVLLALILLNVYSDLDYHTIMGLGANTLTFYFLLIWYGCRLLVPSIFALFKKYVHFEKCRAENERCEACNNNKPDLITFCLYMIKGMPYIYCSSCDKIYSYHMRGILGIMVKIIPYIPYVSFVLGLILFFRLESNFTFIVIVYLIIQLLPLLFLIFAKSAWRYGTFKKSKEFDFSVADVYDIETARLLLIYVQI